MKALDTTGFANAQAVSFDIDRVTEQLNISADKRDELRSRIAYARMCFELIDVDIDTSQLEAEVAEYKRLCACLKWRPQ